MGNFYTRTETPDKKSYVPSKSAEDYKVGSTYEFLFWNGARLTRDNKGDISDDQIMDAFYILDGEVINVNKRNIEVYFSKGLKEPMSKNYGLNGNDKRYLHTWKKLVKFTKEGGSQNAKLGVTEDNPSNRKGVTEDSGRMTGRGVTEDSPNNTTGRGVTEDMPKGVTEDVL
jgi:hypothetical protein